MVISLSLPTSLLFPQLPLLSLTPSFINPEINFFPQLPLLTLTPSFIDPEINFFP